ncbi:LIC_13387 family protein [Aureispira anguillae]|uniref:Uncharacterized protein n=1 Tax=Aureispira anguillae TaxID=2864201 RepID=A0A916DWZ2_9BACT|nr:hypothetical protein [Aureispira anguillae]BDS15220.1 hypothetical protein AsAng_0060040 [Aureispira anguillae]
MTSKTYHKIGAWSFILLGMAHFMGTLLFTQENPKELAIAQAMEAHPVDLLGAQLNLLLLHQGFSLMMGFMVFSYGFINFLFLKSNPETIENNHLLALGNSLVASIALGLSIKYFFIIPIAFTGIACMSFVLMYLKSFQSAKQ